MGILGEVVIDKSMVVPGKTIDNKQPWEEIYEVIDDEYFEKSGVKFPK